LGPLNFNTKIPKIQTVSKGINENVAWNFIEFSEELIKWLGQKMKGSKLQKDFSNSFAKNKMVRRIKKGSG